MVNGVTYEYPETGDTEWGPDATDWAQAITVGTLQKAGGLFQLLADVDFGTTYGIKTLYLKSRATDVASSGTFRLGNNQSIAWRNAANDDDLDLKVNSSDVLEFEGQGISIGGTPVQTAITVSDTATIDLTLTVLNDLSADIVAGSITNSMVNAAAAIAYSKLNLSDSIVNADVSSSAAIAYSKLALTGAIVDADVSASAAIAYSKLALAGSLVNADVNAAAAIAFSKLAALASGNILVGNGSNVATSVAMSGDVTISNAGVTAIGANKVANSQLAQIATARFKGRTTAGTGDVEDLTATQATALLNNVVGDSGSGGTKGLVPAPAAGDAAAGKFLKADGNWVAPSGSGDVVGPASSTDGGFAKFDGTTGKLLKDSAATISNADVNAAAAIAFSKLASLTSAHILVGSAGNVATDVAVTGDISLTNAGVTAYAGTVPLNKGGTGQTTKAAAFDALSPMTTGGDLIYGGASGTGTRLANGSAGQVLTSSGGTSAPTWTDSGHPAGAVIMYGGATAPTGWLLCDGSAVSRTTYAALFAIVSTTYGAGNGTTTFNVPDARGVFVRGAGTQTISAINYTGTRGTTQGDQIQGHFHTVKRNSDNNTSNTGVGTTNNSGGATASTSGALTAAAIVTDGTNGTPRTGSETQPANICLSYIIKT